MKYDSRSRGFIIQITLKRYNTGFFMNVSGTLTCPYLG